MMDGLGPWVERACAMARAAGADAYEARGDIRDDRRIVVHNGVVRSSRLNRTSGLGIRIFAGGGSAYAHATAVDEESLREMVQKAIGLARSSGRARWRTFPPAMTTRKARYAPRVKDAPADADPKHINDLILRAETAAREASPGISVQTSFGARTSSVIVADSAGSWVEVDGLVSTLLVQPVTKDAGRIGDAAEWRAGERGVGDYEDDGGPEELGRIAARNAIESLQAVPFPAGRYRTLTDPHLSGLLAHESFGHLTEHDLVVSGWSVLQGQLGKSLGVPSVTIRDVPIIERLWRRGVAVPLDDEGQEGRDVTLMDKGVLQAWMHTRDSAASEGAAPTGNGRALDARHAPIVRMRNTIIEPGNATLDECLEELRDGVYLIGARGGSPRSDGSFMFTAKRGYVVENGELKAPVRGVAIHGNVLDFFGGVQMLSDAFEVHTNYFGGCGKWEQSFLHVGTGGPHVLVESALVGGQGE